MTTPPRIIVTTFKLADFKRGDMIRLVRNPDYFKKDKPYLDEIDFRVVDSRATRLLAFSTEIGPGGRSAAPLLMLFLYAGLRMLPAIWSAVASRFVRPHRRMTESASSLYCSASATSRGRLIAFAASISA